MKRDLKQIYDDLSKGKLSQKEALDRIKGIKLRKQSGTSVLLASPIWQASDVSSFRDGRQVEHAEHHVMLCELAKVNVEELKSLLQRSQCLSLQGAEDNNIAQRYSEYALACFERIQTILHGKPQGKVLVQIVVPNYREQALLAGLSGLLKTAGLEN